MAYTTFDNNYATARFIVGASGQANYLTIQAAITAASSGNTIFILPGTYTENLTLKAGVNISAYTCDAFTPNVVILGTCTFTGTGVVSISGVQLQTNSAFCLAVTGSAASIVNVNECYFNITNNTGISYTSSNAASGLNIINCNGNIGTTGIALIAQSSIGKSIILDCYITNLGSSLTASTISAGTLGIDNSYLYHAFTSSGTSIFGSSYSTFDMNSLNTTAITMGGSGLQNLNSCTVNSGTASAISIGSTATITGCNIASTNTNAITGAGTINNVGNNFTQSSYKINTSTISPGYNTDTSGISFDGGTNLLSNYVQAAAFTPVLNFGGASTGITYTLQVGEYTRIGNCIFYTLTLVLSSKGALTGSATITGFPINAGGFNCCTVLGVTTGLTLTALYTNPYLQVTTGGSIGGLFQYGSGQNAVTIQNTSFTNTTVIVATGFYFTS